MWNSVCPRLSRLPDSSVLSRVSRRACGGEVSLTASRPSIPLLQYTRGGLRLGLRVIAKVHTFRLRPLTSVLTLSLPHLYTIYILLLRIYYLRSTAPEI